MSAPSIELNLAAQHDQVSRGRADLVEWECTILPQLVHSLCLRPFTGSRALQRDSFQEGDVKQVREVSPHTQMLQCKT